MTSSYEASAGRIKTSIDGHIHLIGIDRPAKLNGFTLDMVQSLARAYTSFERDPALRCALVYAEGPHFTAGIDLPNIAPHLAAGNRLTPNGEVDPLGNRAPLRTKPVVIAVQGICFTLGIELMLAADIVVAASDCRFAQLEVKRGILAAGGATIRMVERAGWGNAMRYLLTGEEFDAETALRLGFIQEIVPPGRQYARALEISRMVAAQAPLAVSAVLVNARLAVEQGPAAAVADLLPTQERLMATEDVKEGLRSFRDRRPALFKGC